MLRIFLTDDALSSKVPQLMLRIATGDCIVKFQFSEQFETLKVVELFEWGIWNKFGHTRKKRYEIPSKGALFRVFYTKLGI